LKIFSSTGSEKNYTILSSDWGSQRIKGLSITGAIKHAIKTIFTKDTSVSQKNVETSLIEQFMYPKLGPGHLWEEVTKIIKKKGGKVHFKKKIVGIKTKGNKVIEATVLDTKTGKKSKVKSDYFFSTMPVKELIAGMTPKPPKEACRVAKGLMYRDFLTVGLLLKKLKIKNKTPIKTINNRVPDTWIYIQERDVKMGRLQIFNNWSPYLVKDLRNMWVGFEYFMDEQEEMWKWPDHLFS